MRFRTPPRSTAPWIWFLIVIGLLSLGSSAGLADEAPQKPNVVFIVADGLGTADLNCFGSKDLLTPHLDALAMRGTKFTQFYVGAPICSPSRAAFFTGRCPQRAGLVTNSGVTGMPAEQYTLGELFRDAGYRTALFGKWHLGHSNDGDDPLGQGFQEFMGHLGGCIDNYSHYFFWHGPNRHDLWRNRTEIFEEGRYFPDMMVQDAKRFLAANATKPFFLCLTTNLPHYPLQPDRKFLEAYAKIPNENRRRYGPFVSTMDDRIGKVLDEIDRLGLRDDTIVVFFSDHGHSTEERTFGGGGSAGGYRGHKGTLWEGGIRVPCIISWPGHLPEDATCDRIATAMDLFPTLAELCGIPLPQRRLDGKSIAALLSGADKDSPHHTLHWKFGNAWAVREGDWKIVQHAREPVLTDMSTAPFEQINLAKKHPEIVARLTALNEEWLKTCEEQ